MTKKDETEEDTIDYEKEARLIAAKLDRIVRKLRDEWTITVTVQGRMDVDTKEWWFMEGKRITCELALSKIGYEP